MNSFNLFAVGQVGKDPEIEGEGDRRFTKFALIGNDFNGTGKEQIVTNVFFVAFNGIAEAIAKHVRRGDQLIIEAQMRSNTWIDNSDRKHFDYSFIVQGFKFGAPGKLKREELASRTSSTEQEAPPSEPAAANEAPKSNGRGRRRAATTDTTNSGAPPF